MKLHKRKKVHVCCFFRFVAFHDFILKIILSRLSMKMQLIILMVKSWLTLYLPTNKYVYMNTFFASNRQSFRRFAALRRGTFLQTGKVHLTAHVVQEHLIMCDKALRILHVSDAELEFLITRMHIASRKHIRIMYMYTPLLYSNVLFTSVNVS